MHLQFKCKCICIKAQSLYFIKKFKKKYILLKCLLMLPSISHIETYTYMFIKDILFYYYYVFYVLLHKY